MSITPVLHPTPKVQGTHQRIGLEVRCLPGCFHENTSILAFPPYTPPRPCAECAVEQRRGRGVVCWGGEGNESHTQGCSPFDDPPATPRSLESDRGARPFGARPEPVPHCPARTPGVVQCFYLPLLLVEQKDALLRSAYPARPVAVRFGEEGKLAVAQRRGGPLDPHDAREGQTGRRHRQRSPWGQLRLDCIAGGLPRDFRDLRRDRLAAGLVLFFPVHLTRSLGRLRPCFGGLGLRVPSGFAAVGYENLPTSSKDTHLGRRRLVRHPGDGAQAPPTPGPQLHHAPCAMVQGHHKLLLRQVPPIRPLLPGADIVETLGHETPCHFQYRRRLRQLGGGEGERGEHRQVFGKVLRGAHKGAPIAPSARNGCVFLLETLDTHPPARKQVRGDVPPHRRHGVTDHGGHRGLSHPARPVVVGVEH
eukprot:Hpha_TRINITY_DN8244_c0_g1::TRINITY_DN8244_c0_g1_i1::g.111961::m.111961